MYLSDISRSFPCNLRKRSLISEVYLKYIRLNFLDIAQPEKIPRICWKNHGKSDNFPTYFDGVPYIFLGNRDYQCHQGKDGNITKNTIWQRSSTSKKIKLVLQQLSIKKATTDDKFPGYLEYVTKFPKGNYFGFFIYDLFIYFCFLYYSSIKVKLIPSSFGIVNHITYI